MHVSICFRANISLHEANNDIVIHRKHAFYQPRTNTWYWLVVRWLSFNPHPHLPSNRHRNVSVVLSYFIIFACAQNFCLHDWLQNSDDSMTIAALQFMDTTEL